MKILQLCTDFVEYKLEALHLRSVEQLEVMTFGVHVSGWDCISVE